MSCALCFRDVELLASHIMPEFLHRPVYDEKHRVDLFKHGDRRSRIVQKSIREKLLCADCEDRFGNLELYFSQYWYHRNSLPEIIRVRLF